MSTCLEHVVRSINTQSIAGAVAARVDERTAVGDVTKITAPSGHKYGRAALTCQAAIYPLYNWRIWTQIQEDGRRASQERVAQKWFATYTKAILVRASQK